MDLEEAVQLISSKQISKEKKQVWADLGCGTGTFTLALASLLSPGSSILAVDKEKSALDKIPDQFENISIKKFRGDFNEIKLPDNLDGVLMGNSLHYVKDKPSFIKKIKNYLNETGSLIIIEYDTDKANTWIPYPVRFSQLKELLAKEGFSTEKTGRKSSVYRREDMYAAFSRKLAF